MKENLVENKKESRKEKTKKFFKKITTFEQRVTCFFCICFAILTIHTMYLSFIYQNINSLAFEVQNGNDYSYYANENTKAVNESVAGLYSYIDKAIKKEKSVLTDVIAQINHKSDASVIKILPEAITEDTEVSVIIDNKTIKATPAEDSYFTVECEKSPDYFVVKLESREGTKTEKVLWEDVEIVLIK